MQQETKHDASIKVSIGDLSVEYSGTQNYIESGLQSLIENIIDLAPQAIVASTDQSKPIVGKTQQNLQHMSTNTIASNMSVKNGPDLIMAAVAHIQLVKGKDRAVRHDIISEIKGATTYYKTSTGSNLSAYLDSLVKSKRLNLISDNTYALTASETSAMEAILASN